MSQGLLCEIEIAAIVFDLNVNATAIHVRLLPLTQHNYLPHHRREGMNEKGGKMFGLAQDLNQDHVIGSARL